MKDWRSWLDVKKLQEFLESRGWSEPTLAKKLDIDYSYLYRVLRNDRKGGAKFLVGFLVLCREEGLNPYDFFQI